MRAGPLGMRLFNRPAAVTGSLGPEIVVDGTFSSSANWNIGANESISSNQAVFSGATAFFWQSNAGIVTGHTYRVTYTVSGYSAGIQRFYLGSAVQQGTSRITNGTFTEDMTATSGGELGFTPSGPFTGNVTNFSIKEVLP